MIPSLSNPLLFYTTLFQHEGHKVHFNAKFRSLEEFTGISLPLISGIADAENMYIQKECYNFTHRL
jgi:hypothetical protein